MTSSILHERREQVSVHVYGENWIVIAFMLTAAFAMGSLLLALNRMVAPAKPSRVKSEPYESGMPGVKAMRPHFTPRYYVVAMLFVVFDLEAIFMFPWAVNFDALGMFGFVEMLVFMALLLAGYVYAWKKGALEWV